METVEKKELSLFDGSFHKKQLELQKIIVDFMIKNNCNQNLLDRSVQFIRQYMLDRLREENK